MSARTIHYYEKTISVAKLVEIFFAGETHENLPSATKTQVLEKISLVGTDGGVSTVTGPIEELTYLSEGYWITTEHGQLVFEDPAQEVLARIQFEPDLKA